MCFEVEASLISVAPLRIRSKYHLRMADAPPSLDPVQLGAYFALIEVSSLLRHAVEQQLREAGNLSYVQFQLLARLGDSPTGSHRMTDLADGVVYSRSGLTYQAGLLEKAGLVTRAPAPEDERGVTVTITEAGRARLAQVFPGHVEVISRLLFEPLSRQDVQALGDLLEPVRDHMRSTPPRSAAPRRRRT
jgi:DNA-binding MarR family transcriptional regulator